MDCVQLRVIHTMPDIYTLTVHIAERGTPLLNPIDGTLTNKASKTGHMWHSIQKKNGTYLE